LGIFSGVYTFLTPAIPVLLGVAMIRSSLFGRPCIPMPARQARLRKSVLGLMLSHHYYSALAHEKELKIKSEKLKIISFQIKKASCENLYVLTCLLICLICFLLNSL